jgi:serine/threonine protein kinase
MNVMAELAKINHPNIMGYYGYKKDESGLYFFVEFCSGGSLKQLITKRMSELKVITLLRQLFDAMTYINKLSNSLPTQTNCTETSNPITSSSMKTRNSK